MMRVAYGPEANSWIAQWVFKRTGGGGGVSATGIAIIEGDRPTCAVAFTDYNGLNVSVHIAVERHLGLRTLLHLTGEYCFNQLGCKRLTFVIESSNVRVVNFVSKLGAVQEGRLVGAGKLGNDILISRLTPDCAIWRALDGKGWRRTSDARLQQPHRYAVTGEPKSISGRAVRQPS